MRLAVVLLLSACGAPPPVPTSANSVAPPSIACPESLLRDFASRVGDRAPAIRVESSGPARIAKHLCPADLDPSQCEARARASVALAPGESISGISGTGNGGRTLGYDVELVVDGQPERFRAITREQAQERVNLHRRQGRQVTSFAIDEATAPGDRIASVAIAGPTAPQHRIATIRTAMELDRIQRDLVDAKLELLKFQRLDDAGTYELTVGCSR